METGLAKRRFLDRVGWLVWLPCAATPGGPNLNIEYAYQTILEKEFDELSRYYDESISYEDYRCLVDVHYRKEHGDFPITDPSMEDRLRDSAIEVGRELFDEMQDAIESWESKQQTKARSEKLIEAVEILLQERRRREKRGFPYSRRFTRADIYAIDRMTFDERDCDTGLGYEDAFTHLQQEGVYRLIERGNQPPDDVFEAVDV